MKKLKMYLSIILATCALVFQSCDQCASTNCLNGGACNDGTCICPTGYSGTYCEISLCDTVNCQNGGTCVGGSCNCPPGYSGSYCENYDSCYNVTCNNGGVCVSGTCDCPPGYTGTTCSGQVTPTSMTITKVVVNSYPTATSSGANWDGGSDNADVFLTINVGASSNQNSFVSGQTFTNADGTALTFTTGFPYVVSAPLNNYSIAVWDDDGSVFHNEKMAGVFFQPTDYDNGFPSTFTLNASNSLSATLHVTWNF